jgi:acyl-CoA oxidase
MGFGALVLTHLTQIGSNSIDNGFARFTSVRVPRSAMLSRHQSVSRDGEYVQHAATAESSAAASKLQYLVMVNTRISMTAEAADTLLKCVTIAVRYSAVRQQGFVDSGAHSHGENPVLDYQVPRRAVAVVYVP